MIVEDTGVPNKVATAEGGRKDLQNKPTSAFFHVFLRGTHHRRPVCGPGCLQKVVRAQPPCEKLCEQATATLQIGANLFSSNSSPPVNKGPYTRRDSNVELSARRFLSSPRTSLDSLQRGVKREEFLCAARRPVKDTKTC